jgi:pyruvate/2-oxoglutarate dehydrogenase complex dihydrolipoamide acyltransferase (E2) component
MPYYDRSVEGGTITRWYKSEGEMVNPGEDLFDLRVDDKKMLVRPRGAYRVFTFKSKKANFITLSGAMLRVVSSDSGCLRKIYAPQGTRLPVGGLAAAVTTDAQEPLNESDPAVSSASAFRVVASQAQPA